jgi:hypothetical protein
MPCACNGGQDVSTGAAPEPKFEVRLPNGRTEIVTGEHAARVAVTMAGGGTYSMVR